MLHGPIHAFFHFAAHSRLERAPLVEFNRYRPPNELAMSNDENDDADKIDRQTTNQPSLDEQMDAFLADPTKKAALLLKMGLDGADTSNGKSQAEQENADNSHHFTPSGKSTGDWPYPPFWPPYPYPPAPFLSYPGPAPVSQPSTGTDQARGSTTNTADLLGPSSTCNSVWASKKRSLGEEDEDTIDLIDEAEARVG